MTSFTRAVIAGLSCVLLSAWALQAPALAAAAPVAVWHMDETFGTVAHDSSGKGNDGDMQNVGFVGVGYSNGAFSFNGKSSRIIVATSSSLNPGVKDFSYTVAARPASVPPRVGDTYDLLRKGLSWTSGGDYKMEIVNVKGGARARCTANDGAGRIARETHPANMAIGAWHVITCARVGSTWTTTVDGVGSTDIVTLGSISNSKVLVLGAKVGGQTGGDWYKGALDEAGVFVG